MSQQTSESSKVSQLAAPAKVALLQPKIVVNVPQPQVIVRQAATNDWLTYGVPYASLFCAFVAALFAVLTWRRMKTQIDVANSQIKLADKQIAQQERALELATNDFAATLESLGITKRQAELADAERMRKPILEVRCNRELEELRLPHGAHDLRFYVHNTGECPASDVAVAFWFSSNFADRLDSINEIDRLSESLQVSRDKKRLFFRNLELIGETEMYHDVGRADRAVLPRLGTFIGHADTFLQAGEYLIVCKVNSAEGEWPEKGFQPIRVIVK